MAGSCRCVALLAAVLLAGCSAHTQVRLGSTTAVGPATGSTTSSAFVGIDVRDGTAAGALIAIGVLGAALSEGTREPRRFPFDFGTRRDAPPAAEDRAIHEQDCSLPIENATANLRCR